MKLKGLLKGFFILGLTLLPISFSSAGQVEQTFNIPDTKIINQSTILLLNNVNFSTTFSSELMNRVFYIMSTTSANGRNKNAYFFAWYQGKPYMYSAYIFDGNVNSSFQGFPTKICITNAGSGSSCSTYDKSVDLFLSAKGFNHGFVSYGNGGSSYDYFKICFGNSEYDYCFQSNAYSWSDNHSQLSGSLNVLSYLPDDVNRIDWGSSYFSPRSLSNVEVVNGVPCYTVGQLFESSSNYFTGLCYSSSTIYSGGSFVSITPKSILELFPSYSDFRSSINLYTNYCTPPATNEACLSAFDGKNEQRSLINKIPDKTSATNLYDLCSMYLNYGLDTNVCTLTGSQITPSYYTSEGRAEALRKQGITIVESSSGSVFETIVGDSDVSADSMFGIKQLFANITSFFEAFNSNEGILPGFIGFFFIAFALLYLFKK